MKRDPTEFLYNNTFSDSNKLTVGDSLFKDDEWDLSPLFPAPERIKGSKKRLNFKKIGNEQMRSVMKHYAYHELGCVKPQTVKSKIQALMIFIQYCDITGLHSFVDVTQEVFLNYSIWLKEEKRYSQQSGYGNCHALEELIRIGQIKRWDVPTTNIFIGVKASSLWNPYEELDKNRIKPIPKDVLDKILWFALHREQNVLTKTGIIIQSQTGLRINEVLSICKGCIKSLDDDHSYLEVTLGKTEKGNPAMHTVLVNELVVNAVHELECHTAKLRGESGLKELFLVLNHGIRISKPTSWSQCRLRNFIRRWDIRDCHGDLYHLKSHQFRATYVADLVKKKIPIAYIMKQFSHVSIEMTAHYLSLKQEEIKEIYSEMLFHPDSRIVGHQARDIKLKPEEQFKGKTTDEIDAITSSLCDTMSFNPLPTGICLYDFRRGNCTNGDGCFFYNCPNFITEARFYPVLKQELELMEKEMDRFKELGRERDWQRQYVKYLCLKPLVENLEDMINDEEKAI